MPIYNASQVNGKYLLEALESIRKQTYNNYELIIINDGSKDNSEELIRNYIAQFPELPIRYDCKKNGGQSSARNYGAKIARGDYLCFLDQDDLWVEHKLELIHTQLNENIDLIYTDADIIDGEGNNLAEKIHQNYNLGAPHPKRSLEDILFRDVVVMPGTMTIKKDIFLKINGFDENLSGYEDDDLFLRIFEIGKITYLPVSTLKWRHHTSNCIFKEGIIKSRIFYWRKLITNYSDNGQNTSRIRIISKRFFKEILRQTLIQYKNNNKLYLTSIATAKEIMPSLPWNERIYYRLFFLLDDKIIIKVISFYLLLEKVMVRKNLRLRNIIKKLTQFGGLDEIGGIK